MAGLGGSPRVTRDAETAQSFLAEEARGSRALAMKLGMALYDVQLPWEQHEDQVGGCEWQPRWVGFASLDVTYSVSCFALFLGGGRGRLALSFFDFQCRSAREITKETVRLSVPKRGLVCVHSCRLLSQARRGGREKQSSLFPGVRVCQWWVGGVGLVGWIFDDCARRALGVPTDGICRSGGFEGAVWSWTKNERDWHWQRNEWTGESLFRVPDYRRLGEPKVLR